MKLVMVVFGKQINTVTLDLLFIMDITESMQDLLDETRNSIKYILDKIKKDSPGIDVRFAYEGYRDFADLKEGQKYYTIDFETDMNVFKNKLDEITALGGGDDAEDVAGGLHAGLNMTWRSNARYAILIADAPGHGSKYHEKDVEDDYPEGDPNGYVLEELMRDYAKKNINLCLTIIDDYTDKMFKAMKEAYNKESQKTADKPKIQEIPYDDEEDEEPKNDNKKEEKKEKEKKNKVDKPKGRSGQNMINVNGKLYIFGGKLGVIQESNELWILDPSIPKYELVHDTLIEKYTTQEIKNIDVSSEKKKKKFHWLTKREVDERTNPLPFALKKSKTTKKLKNNKKDGNRGKLNNSFTEYKTKYSDQVLNRINVRTMKHGLIYNSIYDKLIKANETLKQNEKAMIDKDNNFIIGNVPEPRDGQSCNLFQNNKLVFFGGDRNKFPFNDLYFFDIEGNVLVDYESMYKKENQEFDN